MNLCASFKFGKTTRRVLKTLTFQVRHNKEIHHGQGSKDLAAFDDNLNSEPGLKPKHHQEVKHC